jgi:hypothetical protein
MTIVKRESLFIFLIIFSCLFFTCRKYDDCSAISLRSANAVLVRGVWRIEKYEVNGVDSTDFILNNPYYADIQFTKGIDNATDDTYSAGTFKGSYYFGGGDFYLTGHDTIPQSANALFVRDPAHADVQFHIACLRKNHFWIKADYDPNNFYGHTYNKNNYYIKFKNVK